MEPEGRGRDQVESAKDVTKVQAHDHHYYPPHHHHRHCHGDAKEPKEAPEQRVMREDVEDLKEKEGYKNSDSPSVSAFGKFEKKNGFLGRIEDVISRSLPQSFKRSPINGRL